MMDIRPLRTQTDYEWALQEIEPYFDNAPAVGSEAGNRFEILVKLIAAYEDEHEPIETRQREPIPFLKAFMELTGRSQSDLANLLGSRPRASEVLNKRRALTVEMIHKLHQEWGIPTDCLAVPYALEGKKQAAA